MRRDASGYMPLSVAAVTAFGLWGDAFMAGSRCAHIMRLPERRIRRV